MKRSCLRVLAVLSGLLFAGLCLFLIIQAIPTGLSSTNPPVVAEPAWDSAETRTLVQRACFDCHSNETQWPLYARIAPVSWLVARDVGEGRQALNFSEWGRPRHSGEDGEPAEEIEEVLEVVQKGEMPPAAYTWLHSEARLSTAEQLRLMEGFRQSLQ